MTRRQSFNPRPRTGGDSFPPKNKRPSTTFQSAPPHGGRHPSCRRRLPVPEVSIRAPARGATLDGLSVTRYTVVSIRAPARGATDAMRGIGASFQFQSAPPHGGRHRHGQPPRVRDCFNPRPRTGGDPSAPARAGPWWRFNPRPRTGGDDRRETCATLPSSFNPRPRTGGDTISCCRATSRVLFQSAPPHGGRLALAGIVWLAGRFNPRPRTGGDRKLTSQP